MNNTNKPDKTRPMFSLGTLFATPGALNELFRHNVSSRDLLHRHVTGDWGVVSEHDAHANRFALRAGLRILSSYKIADGINVWIITEADRESTTILLPGEY
jgi:hypothetical protein